MGFVHNLHQKGKQGGVKQKKAQGEIYNKKRHTQKKGFLNDFHVHNFIHNHANF